MPRIVDVSVPVGPGMLTYPGDPVVSLERISDMSAGDSSNVSLLSMSTHTGTHVDPPIHFVADGATIDRLPLDALIGAAHVVDMRGIASIGARDLEDAGLPENSERVLFLTDRSVRWAEASPAFPDIVIVEGLDLREAPAGACPIWCLPLKLRDGDGGPARVVLIVD